MDTHKRNPADFVLWKLSSEDEPGWESPWGRGRPGWHIECSAMSERYLGETFDIHGGGLDLIFPHHENEIAQSRCAHGSHAMANVWMHNGFLQVEGQKMSKSLGNFFTIHQLLETADFGGRKWPGEVLRLAMLMTHYREPIDFSQRRLEEALSLWTRWARVLAQPSAGEAEVPEDFIEALRDDLNSPAAIRRLQAYFSMANNGGITDSNISDAELEERRLRGQAGLRAALSFLGVSCEDGMAEREDKVTETQVTARLAALNAKDFAEADRIRNELADQGIALMDYKDENGQRATKWEVKR